MEVFFNELSCTPLSTNSEGAKEKIINLLLTLKALKNDGFNVMRTSVNFYSIELASDYTFTHFFNDTTISRDLKLLLKGVTKTPYIEDDNSYEAEIFVLTNFKTKGENNEDLSPEGIASAYIFNSPTISIAGNIHWERDTITLTIMPNDTNGNFNLENIPNVFSELSVAGNSFRKWLSYLISGIQLNSKENIIKVFPSNQFAFDTRAINEIISWYYDDKRFLIRIKDLINDIVANPFVGGKGHTETLGGERASKRIIKKDRIVYSVSKNVITIHQCRGHYDDN
jgi:toxin YoeB